MDMATTHESSTGKPHPYSTLDSSSKTEYPRSIPASSGISKQAYFFPNHANPVLPGRHHIRPPGKWHSISRPSRESPARTPRLCEDGSRDRLRPWKREG